MPAKAPFEVITYILRDASGHSDGFYRRLATFTDEVIQAGEHLLPLVETYGVYLVENRLEERRTPPEYLYELLTLGVLWRAYGERAQRLFKTPQRLLAWLARLREKRPALKPVVDFLRGRLAAHYLHPRQARRFRLRHCEPQAKQSRFIERLLHWPAKGAGSVRNDRITDQATIVAELGGLERLLAWLEATGDYAEAAPRLRRWLTWLEPRSKAGTHQVIETALTYAAWFEERSLAVLGEYTPNVERFLVEKHPAYRGRADEIFTGRPRVEYHLNLVGTEIMNRALREVFLATTRKVVLLPPCMAAPAEQCQARETRSGALCAACTAGCRVHQVTQLGEKYGFKVFQLPEELRVFALPADKPRQDVTEGTMYLESALHHAEQSIGVVGVSCALTNANGGWQVRGLGIPAQGLLLDYCGCSYHWHPQGIPTDINIRELLRLLDLDP